MKNNTFPNKKCRGKNSYNKKLAETLKNKLNIEGHKVRVYQCEICNWFHLTHINV